MWPQIAMAVMAAVNAIKSDKESSAMSGLNSANAAASPWTNAKGSVNFSKAPEILSQGVGTYYAMDREAERDKLAKEGRTGEAKAMGATTSVNPWTSLLANSYFGGQNPYSSGGM